MGKNFRWLLLASFTLAGPAHANWNPGCDFRKLLASYFPPPVASSVDVWGLAQKNPPTALKFETKEMNEGWAADDKATNVTYLNDADREKTRLYIVDGRLYDAEGRLANFKLGSLFVMDVRGALYAASPDAAWPRLHHSSFLDGGPVVAAGGIRIKDGIVISVDNGSGHYAPQKRHLLMVRARFAELGADLPLSSMYLYGSSRSLAEPIDFAAFDEPNAFPRLIPAYDPEDWPAILDYSLNSREGRVRTLAVRFLATQSAQTYLDPGAVRALVVRGLADAEPEIQQEAARSLRYWSILPTPLDLYDLNAQVLEGKFSPAAKAEALMALPHYANRPEAFELATTTFASDPNLNPEGLVALHGFLKGKLGDPARSPTAKALMGSILDRLRALESDRDSRRADEARWGLNELTK